MNIALFLTLFGQYDSSIPILTSSQIDVEGTWANPEPIDERSPEEIIQDAQQKAEINNVKRLAKDIENMKVDRSQTKEITDKERAKLSSKIKNVFSSATGESYDGPPASAPVPAPVVPAAPTAPATPSTSYFSFEHIRLIPTIQYLNWLKDLGVNKRYKYGLGLALETTEDRNFSVGFGLNYIQNEITTISRYDNVFKRFAKTNLLQIQIGGKYFVSPAKKIKVFALGKLGFNHLRLSYKNQSSSFYAYYGYGEENYKNTYIDLQIGGGIEFNMNQHFGVTLDMGYGFRLFSLDDDSAFKDTSIYDQTDLTRLGKDLYNSASVNIGLGIFWYF